jgi:hypothetical protein
MVEEYNVSVPWGTLESMLKGMGTEARHTETLRKCVSLFLVATLE